MDREPVPADFIGKTILRWDFSACNFWRFWFTDGSKIAIHAEVFGSSGLPEMTVCESCVDDDQGLHPHTAAGTC